MIVDEILLAYAGAHTSPEPDILAALDRETHLTQAYPRMLSGHLQGALLRMIVQMIRPERVLEIGTGSGYQAAVLAEMGVEVYTVEIIPELARQAAGDEAATEPVAMLNRTLLDDLSPGAMRNVDARWAELVGDWRPPDA